MRAEIVVLAADVIPHITASIEEYGRRGFARQVANYRDSNVGSEERLLNGILSGKTGIQHVERAEALLFTATGDHLTLAVTPHLASTLKGAESMVDGWAFARGHKLSDDEKMELALTVARFCGGYVVGATDANVRTAPRYANGPRENRRTCRRAGCRTPLPLNKSRNARFCSKKCGDADYQLRLKTKRNRSLQPSTA